MTKEKVDGICFYKVTTDPVAKKKRIWIGEFKTKLKP